MEKLSTNKVSASNSNRGSMIDAAYKTSAVFGKGSIAFDDENSPSAAEK